MQNTDGILLEAGTNEVEFMEFQLNDVHYGINVSKIQHVVALANVKITRTAQAHESVLGSIHLHGKPIKVMDLKKALGIPDLTDEENSRKLVMVTKFNGTITAFLIDKISKIHRISWKNFNPINETMGGDSTTSFSTGTITLEDKIIIILDLERLMLAYFPESYTHEISSYTGEYNKDREKVNLVYAEDSKMVRGLTLDTLKAAGYTNVATFENGDEALKYITQSLNNKSNRIDAVLSDIEMPMMDGLTLCRNIKSLCKRDGITIPVIIYSSLITAEMERKCKSIGADAQLAKPEVGKIVRTIDSFCIEGAEAIDV